MSRPALIAVLTVFTACAAGSTAPPDDDTNNNKTDEPVQVPAVTVGAPVGGSGGRGGGSSSGPLNGGAGGTSPMPSNAWIEDFETIAMPTEWSTVSSSVQGTWSTTPHDPHGGQRAAASGDISSDDTTTLSIHLDFAQGGEISFWHRESSEHEYDHLIFEVDGEMLDAWSGETSWTLATYPVSPGVHTFAWTYEKDGSVYAGEDTVWIDDVIFQGATLLP